MAFAFTKDYEGVTGDMRITGGTYTSSGSGTGGDIYTGLQQTQGLVLQQNDSSVVASQAVVNETFPKTDPITIVTVANGTGYWFAFGY